MVPVAFDQDNTVIGPPVGMTEKHCDSISAWMGKLENDVPVTISCWKLTIEEMGEVMRTGRVWLVVMGHGMPPVMLHGASPFEEDT